MFHNTTMYMLSIFFCLDMSIFSGILCDIQFTAVTEIIFSTTRQYLQNIFFYFNFDAFDKMTDC